METCANCERKIGNLEVVNLINDQPVCQQCAGRLNKGEPSAVKQSLPMAVGIVRAALWIVLALAVVAAAGALGSLTR